MNFNASSGHAVKVWSRLAAAGVSVVVLFLIFRWIRFSDLMEVVSGMKIGWFLGALALFGLAAGFAAIRWHVVLRLSGASVHGWATLRAVIIGHLFNTFLFGPAGGDVAKSLLYSRWYGIPRSAILATCALDRLIGGAGFIVFVALTPLLALTSGRRAALPDAEALLPWRFWMIAAAAIIVTIAAIKLHQRFKRPSAFKTLLDTFGSGSRGLLGNPRAAGVALATSFLAHVGMNTMFLLCLVAVTRESFSMADLFWTFPVISLISAAPMTFAGTGLREGAALVLLGLYGIPAADAVAASLLVLLVYLIWAGLAALLFWKTEQRFRTSPSREQPQTITVVIPTLNEAEALPETVRRARAVPEISEIIVVDGGSADSTVSIARDLECRVFSSRPSRGAQLRHGAEQAAGDVIMLLHADTWLPSGAGKAVLACLRDPTVVGGGFWKSFRNPSWLMAGSRFRCLIRLLLGGRIAGDQALFVRRDVLNETGGVPDLPLMEEFELCRRLRQAGQLAIAGATVTTSARRFAKYGVLKTYWRMWVVTLQYFFGVPSHQLQRIYEKD